MHSWIKSQLIARKDQQLDVHGQHQTVCQKRRIIGNPNSDSENIQSKYRIWVWHRKMLHASYKKQQTTHDGRSRTTKSSNNQNTRRKRHLQILGDIESWHHQTGGNQRKNYKRVPQKNQKTTRDKTL